MDHLNDLRRLAGITQLMESEQIDSKIVLDWVNELSDTAQSDDENSDQYGLYFSLANPYGDEPLIRAAQEAVIRYDYNYKQAEEIIRRRVGQVIRRAFGGNELTIISTDSWDSGEKEWQNANCIIRVVPPKQPYHY